MTLVFDADHTLLEFDEDERQAFCRTFAQFGRPITREQAEAYRLLSYEVWNESGLYGVHLPHIQASYHSLYRAYLVRLWERMDVLPPAQAVPVFYEALCAGRAEVEDALFVVRELSRRHTIAIATNGLSDMQRARLTPFLPYVQKVYISEELGCIKPNPAFFERMRQELGEFVMIGDSLSSDVAGAAAAGQHTVWFNRKDWPCETPVRPDREIHALRDLLSLF